MVGEPVVYVGTVGEGLWRSTDGGGEWQRLKNGILSECDVRSIVVDPQAPDHLLIGTNEGIFRSEDAGNEFRACDGDFSNKVVWSLAMSPHEPNRLLAGTRPAHVFESLDGGKSWSQLTTPIEADSPNPALRHNRVTHVGFDPQNKERIWAGVEIGGVFSSPDRGQTWSVLNQGLSSLDVHGMVIVPGPEQTSTLVLSTDNDVNLSTDDGSQWVPQQAPPNFPHRYCRGIAAHAIRREVLFLGNGDGPPGTVGAALRSSDGGHSWHHLQLPGRPNSTVWGFAVHRAEPQRVYAHTVSGQIYLSRNGGDKWEQLRREFGEIRALAWAPPL